MENEAKETCEHELYLYEEEWISNNKLRATLKCDICNSLFRGELE